MQQAFAMGPGRGVPAAGRWPWVGLLPPAAGRLPWAGYASGGLAMVLAGSASGGVALNLPGHASGGHTFLLVQKSMEIPKGHRQDTPKGAVPPLGIPPCCGGGLSFPQSRYGGDLYAKRHRPLPLPGAAAGGGGTGLVRMPVSYIWIKANGKLKAAWLIVHHNVFQDGTLAAKAAREGQSRRHEQHRSDHKPCNQAPQS